MSYPALLSILWKGVLVISLFGITSTASFFTYLYVAVGGGPSKRLSHLLTSAMNPRPGSGDNTANLAVPILFSWFCGILLSGLILLHSLRE